MTVKEAIATADELKPNTFSNDMKTRWLNEIEGRIQTDLFLLSPDDITKYDYEEDAEAELLVKDPHSKLYYWYIMAQIDMAYEDYDKYSATITLADRYLREFSKWLRNNYHPADRHKEVYTDADI